MGVYNVLVCTVHVYEHIYKSHTLINTPMNGTFNIRRLLFVFDVHCN